MAALALGLAVLAGPALASGGQQVTSFNEVPGTAGMVPVASAAGPSASDDLIAGGFRAQAQWYRRSSR
jgi:hypothetical protein